MDETASDLHTKAVQLLVLIADSVHERDPKNVNLLCFGNNEVNLVEEWLKDFVEEQKTASPNMTT